jgi:hypothetical protein
MSRRPRERERARGGQKKNRKYKPQVCVIPPSFLSTSSLHVSPVHPHTHAHVPASRFSPSVCVCVCDPCRIGGLEPRRSKRHSCRAKLTPAFTSFQCFFFLVIFFLLVEKAAFPTSLQRNPAGVVCVAWHLFLPSPLPVPSPSVCVCVCVCVCICLSVHLPFCLWQRTHFSPLQECLRPFHVVYSPLLSLLLYY